MTLIFDSLPNEVLLEIMFRIPVRSEGNFRTMRLVNRHLRNLIDTHESTIIQGTASCQFPIASRATSSHPDSSHAVCPHAAKHKDSMWCLKRMARETEAIFEFVELYRISVTLYGLQKSRLLGMWAKARMKDWSPPWRYNN